MNGDECEPLLKLCGSLGGADVVGRKWAVKASAHLTAGSYGPIYHACEHEFIMLQTHDLIMHLSTY